MSNQKFVVVLNRSHELSCLTSALGHVTAGLAASLSGRIDDMAFLEYKSADGEVFPWISDHSFVVLKGRGGQMKTFRQSLVERDLPCVSYLDTMLEGGTEVEMAATAARVADELEVLAVATFGDREEIDVLTKKFSLYQ